MLLKSCFLMFSQLHSEPVQGQMSQCSSVSRNNGHLLTEKSSRLPAMISSSLMTCDDCTTNCSCTMMMQWSTSSREMITLNCCTWVGHFLEECQDHVWSFEFWMPCIMPDGRRRQFIHWRYTCSRTSLFSLLQRRKESLTSACLLPLSTAAIGMRHLLLKELLSMTPDFLHRYRRTHIELLGMPHQRLSIASSPHVVLLGTSSRACLLW